MVRAWSRLRLRHRLVAFFAARSVINTLYRMIYPFTGIVARGLGVGAADVAAAIGFRSALGLAAPLLGSAADLRGRKPAMLFGLGLFVAGGLLIGLWPSFLPFVAGLMLTTAGKITFDPAMQAFLGDATGYERRGQAIALTELGWSLSFLVGVPVMGLVIARAGWSGPFPILAVLGLAAMGMLGWMLPSDPPRQPGGAGLLRNLRSILAHRPAVAGLAMGALLSAANESVNIVLGIWLETSFGMRVAALGAAAALIGLAELSGEGLVAAVADRIGKRRAVAAGIALNAVAGLLLPFLGREPNGARIGLFLFYLTFEFTLVSSIPLMTELAPRARATMMSGNIAGLSAGRVAGAAVGLALFPLGIAANSAAAVGINLLALLVLLTCVREGPAPA